MIYQLFSQPFLTHRFANLTRLAFLQLPENQLD